MKMWIVNVNTSLPFPCQTESNFLRSRLRLVKKMFLHVYIFITPLKYVKSIQLLFTSVCMLSIFSMMESRDFCLWKRSVGHRAGGYQNFIHSAPRKRFISEAQACSGGRWPPPHPPTKANRYDVCDWRSRHALRTLKSSATWDWFTSR